MESFITSGPDIFLSLEIVFILANRAVPDQMPPYADFIWVINVCQNYYTQRQKLSTTYIFAETLSIFRGEILFNMKKFYLLLNSA